jgi:hypothetical protein
MSYEATLLVFGILLLLIGLIGKVKAKELEIGTSSAIARALTGLVGIVLIVISLILVNAPFLSPGEQTESSGDSLQHDQMRDERGDFSADREEADARPVDKQIPDQIDRQPQWQSPDEKAAYFGEEIRRREERLHELEIELGEVEWQIGRLNERFHQLRPGEEKEMVGTELARHEERFLQLQEERAFLDAKIGELEREWRQRN